MELKDCKPGTYVSMKDKDNREHGVIKGVFEHESLDFAIMLRNICTVSKIDYSSRRAYSFVIATNGDGWVVRFNTKQEAQVARNDLLMRISREV